MSETTPTHGIVVGIDSSPESRSALLWAAEQAHLDGAPLTLVHAVPVPVRIPVPHDLAWRDRVRDERRLAGRALLRDAIGVVHHLHPDLDVDEALRDGSAPVVLLELSTDASLVVVGSRGRGPVSSFLLGSTSSDLTRNEVCPVVIAHPVPDGAERRIAVATDGSRRSSPALAFAFTMAASRSVPLDVLSCFWSPPGLYGDVADDEPGVDDQRSLVETQLQDLREAYPDVETRIVLSREPVNQRLSQANADHELVVVGHHHLDWLEQVMVGSTAARFVEHGRGPIAVVPSGDDTAA